MKENTFSEHDSLDLIVQMIRQSKKNMKVGSGNILLYYGYPALLLSVAVYLLVHLTGKPMWSALWFFMFVPAIWIRVSKNKSKVCVVTYMDKAIDSIWCSLGEALIAFAVAIYMLVSMTTNTVVADWWNLLFGVSFLMMMVIPGHLLNHKIKEPC